MAACVDASEATLDFFARLAATVPYRDDIISFLGTNPHEFTSVCRLSYGIQQTTTKMSDDDFKIESADAGASATIPMEAGQIKKGGYVPVCRCPDLGVLSVEIPTSGT